MEKYDLIISDTKKFLSGASQSLDEKLKKINLPEGKIEEIATAQTKKVIRDRVLGLFKVGELISSIINWNNDIDNEIREAKKERLLQEYFNKCDKNEDTVSKLRDFLSNPNGNTLFNKTLRILDDTTPDINLIEYLANALNFIINSDFVSMFEDHKYALALIEQQTPQSLTILADYRSWPDFSLPVAISTAGKITSDWLDAFIRPYVVNRNISDPRIIERIRNSMNELISKRFVEAVSIANNQAKPQLTDTGNLLLRYISKRSTVTE